MTSEEFSRLSVYVHDARKPLNRISMQAELVKMALNGDVPPQKALVALDKIISSAKDCSHTLAELTSAMSVNISE
jgi:signal transduction histidine kinase